MITKVVFTAFRWIGILLLSTADQRFSPVSRKCSLSLRFVEFQCRRRRAVLDSSEFCACGPRIVAADALHADLVKTGWLVCVREREYTVYIVVSSLVFALVHTHARTHTYTPSIGKDLSTLSLLLLEECYFKKLFFFYHFNNFSSWCGGT